MRLWVPILVLLVFIALAWVVIRGLIDLVAWFRDEIVEDWRSPRPDDYSAPADEDEPSER